MDAPPEQSAGAFMVEGDPSRGWVLLSNAIDFLIAFQ